MEEAACYVGPIRTELRTLGAPMGIAAAPDDEIHPLATAREWAGAAPRAGLRTVCLSEFGPSPEALGEACLTALRAAG